MTGTEAIAQLLGSSRATRERLILALFQKEGSTPPFMEGLVTIKVTEGPTTIEYDVSPDYLCLGTNLDYFRVPMAPTTAQVILNKKGGLLPTKRMVDQIYRAATKLSPKTYRPSAGQPGREDTWSYGDHNRRVQEQLLASGITQGTLLAGHKKDVVITNQLAKNPKKVAIYGWHDTDGKAIQPLYLGHGDFYADYSHGIRFVSKRCRVNGVERNLEEVLQDKELGPMLTGDTPLQVTRYK
ncbi:MAG: hypothetical protein E6R04_11285 [Spirochaetes bacterium]|nr:MAG: hypothetical protein E6R04_11285 [Spirochaetota bacterium]